MKKNNLYFFIIVVLLLVCCSTLAFLYMNTKNEIGSLSNQISNQTHQFGIIKKKVEDTQWYNLVGDIAYIDKVRLAGPPHHNPKKTNVPFFDKHLNNDVIFYSYVFIPKNIDINKQYPLIVFSHGGIHGDFSVVYSHVIKELLSQGYIIVAPDYRGSTGYGHEFWKRIDYGGRENEDVLASRKYMIENYSIVDSTRVGALGWSHGGMISLMNILQYPDQYACAYAGVPVSDVIYRLEYQKPSYSKLFSADYHIGQTVSENPEEYKRRSPVSYAKLLKRPLMITTAENDDDVSVTEVQRMIDSLKYYNKDFEYKVYGPKAGAHLFDRIDIKEATDIRFKAYQFLSKYLNPPYPFANEGDMRKAGYGFK